MKALILPDAHLHLELLERVHQLLAEHKDWQCVSLGDWSDDWNRPAKNYETFFDYFLQFCKQYQYRLYLCWGNHDYGYWSYPGHHSGYSVDAERIIRDALWQIDQLCPIQAVWQRNDVIFSHAGITKGMLLKFLTSAHKHPKWSLVDFCNNQSPHDYWEEESPLWHRPSNNYHKNTFNPLFLQVVGHTPVPTVTHTPEDNIIYTDTWSTDSDYNPMGDKSLVLVDTEVLSWRIINYDGTTTEDFTL